MGLWQVDVREERTARFYVRADTEAEAREDAEELASEISADAGWDDITQDVDLMVARDEPLPNAPVWSGGPEGGWE